MGSWVWPVKLNRNTVSHADEKFPLSRELTFLFLKTLRHKTIEKVENRQSLI